MQGPLINVMFVMGVGFITSYVALWILSPAARREIEKPRYDLLERDRRVWKSEP